MNLRRPLRSTPGRHRGRPLAMLALGALLAAALAGATGCAGGTPPRCYVHDDQYREVRQLYLQIGALDLIERHLGEMKWRRCKINEVVYRLQKEFEVLPEDLPSAAPVEAPAELLPRIQ